MAIDPNELAKQFGGVSSQDTVDTGVTDTGGASGQPLSFGERFKMSFGSPQVREQLKQRETQAGLRGKLDVGDIADVAGRMLSFGGGVAGGALGGLGGAAVGVGLGELSRQAIDKAFGISEQYGSESPFGTMAGTQEAATQAGITYLGGKLLAPIGKYVASRVSKLLGIATGEKANIITAAMENPAIADIGVKNGDKALNAVIQKGARNSLKLRTDFVTGHANAIQRQVFDGLKTSTNAAQQLKQTVVKNLVKALDVQRVGVSAKKLDFTKSIIKANPGEAGKVQDAFKAVLRWNDWSSKGVHELKQLVGKLTKFPTEAGGTSKSPFLGQFYDYLDNIVKGTLPQDRATVYGTLNKTFHENISLYDGMVKAFNSGDPFARLAQLFNENKYPLQQLIKFYEQATGEAVYAVAAGRKLAMERTSGGLLGTGLGFRNFIDAIWSPAAQGATVTRAGKMAGPTYSALSTGLPPLIPEVTERVVNLFKGNQQNGQ